MVLAVNWPPQAPAEGQATCSSVVEVLVGHLADRVQADRLEDVRHGDVAALERAGQDRAAIDEDRRHVEPAHRHHHAGQRLVAAGHADQRVVAVAAHGQLDGIGDDLAADQRGLHALVAHGDAVGDGDGAELARRAVGGRDALLHRPAPGASARCCRARPRSSRSRRRRRAGGSPRGTGPSRNSRSDAARATAPPSRGGWAVSTCRRSGRPCWLLGSSARSSRPLPWHSGDRQEAARMPGVPVGPSVLR